MGFSSSGRTTSVRPESRAGRVRPTHRSCRHAGAITIRETVRLGRTCVRHDSWPFAGPASVPRASRRILIGAGVSVLAALAIVVSTSSGRNALWSAYTRLRGRATVEERLAALGPNVRADVRSWCTTSGLEYPPDELALVAFKGERELHVYGRSGAEWRHLVELPIVGASGRPGPKLAEGDGQVPEGIYAIESLHPNSRYHLALKVAYPNESDRSRAESDGRTALGGDIMIHGGSLSIGCIAIGDPAIERVFLLVAEVGVEDVRVVVAPSDLRAESPEQAVGSPAWLGDLYSELRRELEQFPAVR